MKSNLHQSTKRRIIYLDITRSLAIVSVSFNHAVNRSFAIVTNTQAEYRSLPVIVTLIKVVLYVFSRIGVPLFVMITGALLLARDYRGEGAIRFVKHNWMQLFITTELWLAIMFWYKQLFPGSILLSYGVRKCLIRFVGTMLFIEPDTMGSMWYMFMILCLYLVIPLFSIAIEELKPNYLLLPLTIIFLTNYVLSDINPLLNGLGYSFVLTSKLEPAHIFSVFSIYLLFGYYISKGYLSHLKTSFLVLCLLSGFSLFCGYQFWIYSCECDNAISYLSVFPIIVSVCLFELIKRTKIKTNSIIVRICSYVARVSFGIYFIHICIMDGLRIVIDHLRWQIDYLWRFVFLEVVSFGGAIIIIQLLKNNKWISKYLLGIKED